MITLPTSSTFFLLGTGRQRGWRWKCMTNTHGWWSSLGGGGNLGLREFTRVYAVTLFRLVHRDINQELGKFCWRNYQIVDDWSSNSTSFDHCPRSAMGVCLGSDDRLLGLKPVCQYTGPGSLPKCTRTKCYSVVFQSITSSSWAGAVIHSLIRRRMMVAMPTPFQTQRGHR